MNVPYSEVVEMPARSLPIAPTQSSRSGPDVERGVELFILAAATFFRSAAAKTRRGRRRPNGAKVRAARKAAPAASKRRAKKASAKPQ